MMPEHEAGLLQRFSRNGDADAFAQITRLYADMVYGTCLRITRNEQDAADATQDTFFQLVKNAARVTGSLGGWLHRVASRRSLDQIRQACGRREREQAYARQEPIETDKWEDISPLVDESMGEMDEDLREVIILYFLQGKSMVQIAALQGTAQSTVSRHIDRALAQLRDKLRSKGVIVGLAMLAALMTQAGQTAPGPVLMELGKMAAASGTMAESAVPAGLGSVKLGLLAVTMATLSVGGALIYKGVQHPTAVSNPGNRAAGAPIVLAQNPPAAADAANPRVARIPRGALGAPAGRVSQVTPAGQPPVAGGAGVAVAAGPRFGGGAAQGFGGFAGPAPSLASPPGAVYRLTSALSQTDMNQLKQAFIPDGTGFEAVRTVLENPQTDADRELKQCLQSLSVPVEVVEMAPDLDGFEIKWKATVRAPFTRNVNGAAKTWQKGEKFEMQATLALVGKEWKVNQLKLAAE